MSEHRSAQSVPPPSPWPYALCLMVVSVCWAVQYPFWPYRDVLLDQGKISHYSGVALGFWGIGLVVWLWSMWMLCKSLRGSTIASHKMLVGTTSLVMLGSFVSMYPTNAIDVFIYATRSRLLTEYGENPNAIQPIFYWSVDPYMSYASKEWADSLSPYGPLWNQLAAPITWIGGDSIAIAVIGFKLLSVFSVLGVAWFIHDIVRQRYPEWALVATLFWLWNPLVMWDGVGNAHNDVTLMLPVMAALWAWTKGYHRAVVPLLLASILIKYVTIILLPLAIVALWRQNRSWAGRVSGILWSLFAAILLIGASLFPFYDLHAVRTSAAEQGAKVAGSLAWLVLASSSRWDWEAITPETARNVAYAIVSVFIAGWVIACWKKPERLIRACFEVMFVFMIIASTNQRAWYVIWLVPLAAVLIPERPWRRAMLWSITSLLGHACSIWLWSVWNFAVWGRYWYSTVIVGVVFVPVIMLTASELISWKRGADSSSRVLATGPAFRESGNRDAT